MDVVSRRLRGIKASATVELNALAMRLQKEGRQQILNLCAGEPDFPTAENIVNAAKAAMDNGNTRYTASDGIVELKSAISKKLQMENGHKYTNDQIIVSSGGKEVIFNAMFASLNSGDEVIIPAPYWVSYPDIVNIAEGKAVIVPCGEEDGFKLTASALNDSITDNTKWLILNSPSNPTGAVYSREELQELAEVLLTYPHVHIMTDDIYEHLLYDGKEFVSIHGVCPELFGRVLVVNGVSKSYAMTGWRIGYGAGNIELVRAMKTLQSQSTTCPCSVSQWAALEALTGDQSLLAERRQVFQDRRERFVSKINDIPGLSCIMPDGAFYMWVCCADYIGKTTLEGSVIVNDEDFVKFLLTNAGVATVHGKAFGLSPYFRISYATSDTVLEQACDRITQACSMLRS